MTTEELVKIKASAKAVATLMAAYRAECATDEMRAAAKEYCADHSTTLDLIDTIERQAEAIKLLREALSVFAKEADIQDVRNPHADEGHNTVGRFTIRDVRNARNALSQTKDFLE